MAFNRSQIDKEFEALLEQDTFGDQFDSIPVMDFGVSYPLQENLEIEAGTSYNFEDDERGDITLRATFSF